MKELSIKELKELKNQAKSLTDKRIHSAINYQVPYEIEKMSA